MEIAINIDAKDIVTLLEEPTIRAEIRKIAAEEIADELKPNPALDETIKRAVRNAIDRLSESGLAHEPSEQSKE